MRKPRHYRRVSIYTDDDQDRLRKLIDDVKREQGEKPDADQPYNPDKFRGTFINFTPRAQRLKEEGSRIGWPVAIVIIFALILVWRFLMTGRV